MSGRRLEIKMNRIRLRIRSGQLSHFFFFIFILNLILNLNLSIYGLAVAADNQWSGAGDGIYWKDGQNWSRASVPAASDDVRISKEDADVYADETFNAKSLNVGGRGRAVFNSENFVYGNIAPAAGTDIALYIRKDGEVTLKGAGDITVKGQLKNSQETLVSEPSFMFVLE